MVAFVVVADTIVKLLVPQEDADERSAILEVRAGWTLFFLVILAGLFSECDSITFVMCLVGVCV
jgi:hypothetical protein